MQIAQLLSDFRKRSLALLILLASVQSQALTLGRIQGAALIGHPLLASIAVQAEPGQNLATSCFEADVFHGDNKQNPARVRLRLEPAASGQGSILRLTSDTPVNEPIVTVYLRVACAQAISRRYVILADIVSEQVAPVAPRVGVVPLVIPVPTSAGAPPVLQAAETTAPAIGSAPASAAPDVASSAQGAAVRRVPGAGQAPTAQESAKRPAKVAAPKPAPIKPVAAKPAVVAVKPAPAKPAAASAVATAPDDKVKAGRIAGQSRLRLDPLELLSERVATLESVSANVPTEIAAREARDAQRLDSLEASVKTMVALAAKNEVSLLELRARLERAQVERYNNPVVYLLLALLLLSLLAIAYLLSRSSRRAQQEPADNWWDGSAGRQASEARASAPAELPAEASAAYSEPDSSLAAMSEPSPLSQSVGLSRSSPPSVQQTQPITQGLPLRHAGAVPAQVDVSLVEMSESTFDRLMQSGTAHSAVRKTRDDETAAGPAGPGAAAADGGGHQARRIDSDELVDVRQRAEFFVSLGQTDQAVQVLEARIAQDSTSCPQAYLDLLKLFQSLGLKADFLNVRDDFTQIFNVQVPEFAEFEEEGRSLEDYPGTVDRLIAVWDRASVLDVIEHLLYRQQGDTSHQPFDLAGFRDLLALHAVGQAVRGSEASDSGAGWRPQFPPLGTAELDINLSELLVEPSEPTIDLPASTTAKVTAGASAAADNLIDFDLTEVPFDKKPDAS
jgi:pilus assembly protein FimV